MENVSKILHERPSGILVFDSAWIDSPRKTVAPFASGRGMVKGPLIDFIQAVKTRGGESLLFFGISSSGQSSESGLVLGEGGEWGEFLPSFISSNFPDDLFEGVLVYSEVPEAALLYTSYGYTLVAGDDCFIGRFSPEGVDALKVKFFRHARRIKGEHDFIREVAELFPPSRKAWKHPEEVDPDSHVSSQLTLMGNLINGEISPENFLREWLRSRRRAFDSGERVRGSLEKFLDEVFYALEDYEPDPECRSAGGLGDDELIAKVREVLHSMG